MLLPLPFWKNIQDYKATGNLKTLSCEVFLAHHESSSRTDSKQKNDVNDDPHLKQHNPLS